MINELTPENVKAMETYVSKWVGKGLSTDSLDLKETKEIINKVYTVLLEKPLPETVLILSSPHALWNYICEQIGSTIDFICPYLCGSFDSNIFAFYDYFLDELNVKITPDLLKKYKVWRKTTELGFIYPFDDVCLVSKKPIKIHRKGTIVHNETGPAIEFEDGFSVYVLNGIRMKREYVETPWDKIDVRSIITETNAEVRRELVRKIGIERIIKELGAEVIDRATRTASGELTESDDNSEYELLLLDIGDNRKRPYLKMINPSIGTYHIEGVSPECKTVKEALKFRNGTEELPKTLT